MNNQSIPIITIDGPSSSGKGSISRKLASELNWNILDSGALYRIVAFSAKLNEIPIKNESLVKNSISKLKTKFKLLDTFVQKIFFGFPEIVPCNFPKAIKLPVKVRVPTIKLNTTDTTKNILS